MRDTLMAYLGLKDVLRQGWVNAGVEAPESVAAHSWGMAVLALKPVSYTHLTLPTSG